MLWLTQPLDHAVHQRLGLKLKQVINEHKSEISTRYEMLKNMRVVQKNPRFIMGSFRISSYNLHQMRMIQPDWFRHKQPVPSQEYVDRVIMTSNTDNERIYKIMYRDSRRPELGDKFASRHGQKGVVGLIVNQEDMPFSETGWCPDIIMNPHGFPSRMTVGKMFECIGSKAAAMEGTYCDGS